MKLWSSFTATFPKTAAYQAQDRWEPRRSGGSDVIVARALPPLLELQSAPHSWSYLCSLKPALLVCDFGCMREREVQERGGRWGNGGKKASKLQIVRVRARPLLFLATTLHTAGRLIHSNYSVFFVIGACHPSPDQTSLNQSKCKRPARELQRKKIHYASVAHARRVER